MCAARSAGGLPCFDLEIAAHLAKLAAADPRPSPDRDSAADENGPHHAGFASDATTSSFIPLPLSSTKADRGLADRSGGHRARAGAYDGARVEVA